MHVDGIMHKLIDANTLPVIWAIIVGLVNATYTHWPIISHWVPESLFLGLLTVLISKMDPTLTGSWWAKTPDQ